MSRGLGDVYKRQNSSEEKQLTKEDIISIFNELNFVNKNDLNDINNKIKSIEAKISELEK